MVDDDPNIIRAYERILLKGESGNDNAGISDNMRSILDMGGAKENQWEVTIAKQGLEAVEAVREATEAGKPFAVALVDVRMPPGIDGIEAARRMREIDPKLYLAIVTAYADRSVNEMQAILQRDFILLRKPFEADEIYQIVSHFTQAWSERENEQS